MALTDWELWACAAKVIEDHGENAAAHATEMAQALLGRHDADGCETWTAILLRVRRLQSPPHVRQ